MLRAAAGTNNRQAEVVGQAITTRDREIFAGVMLLAQAREWLAAFQLGCLCDLYLSFLSADGLHSVMNMLEFCVETTFPSFCILRKYVHQSSRVALLT
jgi:hypothetical protein